MAHPGVSFRLQLEGHFRRAVDIIAIIDVRFDLLPLRGIFLRGNAIEAAFLQGNHASEGRIIAIQVPELMGVLLMGENQILQFHFAGCG